MYKERESLVVHSRVVFPIHFPGFSFILILLIRRRDTHYIPSVEFRAAFDTLGAAFWQWLTCKGVILNGTCIVTASTYLLVFSQPSVLIAFCFRVFDIPLWHCSLAFPPKSSTSTISDELV